MSGIILLLSTLFGRPKIQWAYLRCRRSNKIWAGANSGLWNEDNLVIECAYRLIHFWRSCWLFFCPFHHNLDSYNAKDWTAATCILFTKAGHSPDTFQRLLILASAVFVFFIPSLMCAWKFRRLFNQTPDHLVTDLPKAIACPPKWSRVSEKWLTEFPAPRSPAFNTGDTFLNLAKNSAGICQ